MDNPGIVLGNISSKVLATELLARGERPRKPDLSWVPKRTLLKELEGRFDFVIFCGKKLNAADQTEIMNHFRGSSIELGHLINDLLESINRDRGAGQIDTDTLGGMGEAEEG